MANIFGSKEVDLRAMSHAELVEYVIRQEQLSVLEVELVERLEAYVNIHGDYLTDVLTDVGQVLL